VRFTPRPAWLELRIPLPERMPFDVRVDEGRLTVDVYGAVSTTNYFRYGGMDPMLERAEWTQAEDSVFRVTALLAHPPWGWDAGYDQAGALVVRIRRPPIVDPGRPLAGLLVAVDAGHPPGGAIGPTGYTEAEANLGIARALERRLEAAGARVLMTRTDTGAVSLGARPAMALEADAHLLVSIHNDAFPDGVNPFENNGSGVYYYHPHAAGLAAAILRELLAELGLRDLGLTRGDLALPRPSWMPAVLTESAFLMVPRQEAALRDPAVQDRIAAAHLRGIEAFVRARARH
jgi:N-acetylmuramoyl-L-alanine amidase